MSKLDFNQLEKLKALANLINNGFAGNDSFSKDLAKLVLAICDNCHCVGCDTDTCWDGIGR